MMGKIRRVPGGFREAGMSKLGRSCPESVPGAGAAAFPQLSQQVLVEGFPHVRNSSVPEDHQ